MVRSIRAFTLRGACNVLLMSTQLVDTCVALELAARNPSHWHIGEIHAHSGIPHVDSRATRVATGGCAASTSAQPVHTCVAFELAARSPSHWHIDESRARVGIPYVSSRATRVGTGGCIAAASPRPVDTCVAFELAARSPSHWHAGEFRAHAGIPHANSRATRLAVGGCAASMSPQLVDTCVAFELAARSPSHWHNVYRPW